MKEQTSNDRIGLRDKMGMLIGAESGIGTYIVLSMYLLYFYSNVIGLNIGIVGTIIFVSKILDGVSDIVAGFIVDRTKTRFGAARAWVLWNTVPMALTFILLFMVPTDPGFLQYVYVFFSYNLFTTICFTMQGASGNSLPTYITRDQNSISTLIMFQYIGVAVTGFIVSSFAMNWISMLGGDRNAWLMLSGILAVIGMVSQLCMFLFTRERVNLHKMTGGQNVSIWAAVRSIFKNKYWVYTTLIGCITSCVQVAMGIVNAYYAQYILNDVTLVGPITAAFMLPPIFTFMVIGPLLKRISRRSLVRFMAVVGLVGQAVIVFAPTTLPVIMAGMILKGMAYASISMTCAAMMSASIEYGHWKTGVRSQAVLMSAKSMGEKIATGVVSAVIGWILAFAGFNGMVETQSASAIGAINGMFVWMPFLFYGIVFILIHFYHLDKEYPVIMTELEQRMSNTVEE